MVGRKFNIKKLERRVDMKYLGFLILCVFIMSCKKNDPIADLGTTNNEFASQLRVTYNNTAPVIGDTLVISASTWQRDDRFQKVDIFETVVEAFGIDMTLTNGTSVLTKTADESTLTVVDSILKKNVLLQVNAVDMDKHWVTASNNYIINYSYILKLKNGRYANNTTLIEALTDEEFDVLKGILSYSIIKSDYQLLFPAAPATHFRTSGTPVLSETGISNLRANLTRSMLKNIVKTIKKVGSYNLTVDVAAVTPTNATTSSTRTFNIKL